MLSFLRRTGMYAGTWFHRNIRRRKDRAILVEIETGMHCFSDDWVMYGDVLGQYIFDSGAQEEYRRLKKPFAVG